MTDWKLIEQLAAGVDMKTLWIDDCGDAKGSVDAREFVIHLVNAWPDIQALRASPSGEAVERFPCSHCKAQGFTLAELKEHWLAGCGRSEEK